MVRELDKRVETYMMKFVMCFAGVLFGSVMNAQPIDNSIAEDTIMEDENYSSDQPIDIERESSEELLSVETPPPFNISVLTGWAEEYIQLTANVYPNSTLNFVQLEMNIEGNQNLQYDLRNSDGRSLLKEDVKMPKTKIDFSELHDSYYFLVVSENDVTVKTYKIAISKEGAK